MPISAPKLGNPPGLPILPHRRRQMASRIGGYSGKPSSLYLRQARQSLNLGVTMSETLKDYVRVAKPGIVLGNLISAAGGFCLGARGPVDVPLLLITLTGISLVVAAGCVLNNCIDRKIDRKMPRTRERVLARRRIAPRNAVRYALLLGLAGTGLLCSTTHRLCVILVLAGFVIYVAVYSLYLKRRSLYATLIGSLAGTAPIALSQDGRYCVSGEDSGRLKCWQLYLDEAPLIAPFMICRDFMKRSDIPELKL